MKKTTRQKSKVGTDSADIKSEFEKLHKGHIDEQMGFGIAIKHFGSLGRYYVRAAFGICRALIEIADAKPDPETTMPCGTPALCAAAQPSLQGHFAQNTSKTRPRQSKTLLPVPPNIEPIAAKTETENPEEILQKEIRHLVDVKWGIIKEGRDPLPPQQAALLRQYKVNPKGIKRFFETMPRELAKLELARCLGFGPKRIDDKAFLATAQKVADACARGDAKSKNTQDINDCQLIWNSLTRHHSSVNTLLLFYTHYEYKLHDFLGDLAEHWVNILQDGSYFYKKDVMLGDINKRVDAYGKAVPENKKHLLFAKQSGWDKRWQRKQDNKENTGFRRENIKNPIELFEFLRACMNPRDEFIWDHISEKDKIRLGNNNTPNTEKKSILSDALNKLFNNINHNNIKTYFGEFNLTGYIQAANPTAQARELMKIFEVAYSGMVCLPQTKMANSQAKQYNRLLKDLRAEAVAAKRKEAS